MHRNVHLDLEDPDDLREQGRHGRALGADRRALRAIEIARRSGRDAAHQTTDDHLHAVSAPSDVAEQAATNAQSHHVLSALAQLPDAQHEVITLAFYGGLSHTEIAAHLDLPPGSVKGRMRLGLQRLHEGQAHILRNAGGVITDDVIWTRTCASRS